MWLLYFWLISSGMCILTFWLMGLAVAKRIKREYPNYKGNKKSFAEIICACLPLLIPFINILITIGCVLQQEKVYQDTLEKLNIKDDNKDNQ